METRVGYCLFLLFSEWIWLFIITSTPGGTKAEVRCIPSCQLPLIEALSREPPALDLAHFGATPAEELVGFSEGSLSADESQGAAGITESEQSSFKVEPRLEENSKSSPQRYALNGHQKLSHPPRGAPRALPPALINVTSDGRNDSFYVNNGNVTVTEDSWKRLRSARSAETWSGFRSEGVDDAPDSDQEEFQLTSSIFALTGDTAHNQAMVHWSGQNSSVSSLVCVLHIYARTSFDAVWSAATHSHFLCGIWVIWSFASDRCVTEMKTETPRHWESQSCVSFHSHPPIISHTQRRAHTPVCEM